MLPLQIVLFLGGLACAIVALVAVLNPDRDHPWRPFMPLLLSGLCIAGIFAVPSVLASS